MPGTSTFFKSFFENARTNAILIMNYDGTIREMNKAFKNIFGYTDDDLVGNNFSMLFTEQDQAMGIPEREIANTIRDGAADDNNYLVIKDGSRVWVTGESVAVQDDDEVCCIIKVIHNIQAQKLLERFLSESNVVLDGIFDTITNTALAVVDGRMEIVRVNESFLHLFDLGREEIIGKRLTDLKQLFSIDSDLRQRFRDMIVRNESLKGVEFELIRLSGEKIEVKIYSKLVEAENLEKRILLVINNLSDK
jgi:PAS domain S-box-containing protein